ncbi:MAG: metallopeptidase TldD-related protein, partial [Candidatus Alcyoniella australis]|nr:metallopeptidase TldD-related protein [Candidatus Alcyoniella australis]
LSRLGADKIDSGEMPVIFSPEVAARFAHDVVGALDGDEVFKGSSFLGDKLGQQVAAPLFTLVDDPTLARRTGSEQFDGEGVATRRNVLFESGVLKMFLYDCYTARKAGTATTANARRGYSSLPGVSAHQLVLQPGTTPNAEIFSNVERGLYVTRLMGGRASTINGDYSRGARGALIENGKLTQPVQEVTMAGNMLQMLADIEALGDQAIWYGSSAAPPLRFKLLAVSGR